MPNIALHLGIFLHAVKLRHGTDGFTSPPKEGVLRIFRPKNPTASAGFEPANLGTKGQHATSRPPKPLHIGLVPTSQRTVGLRFEASFNAVYESVVLFTVRGIRGSYIHCAGKMREFQNVHEGGTFSYHCYFKGYCTYRLL